MITCYLRVCSGENNSVSKVTRKFK